MMRDTVQDGVIQKTKSESKIVEVKIVFPSSVKKQFVEFVSEMHDGNVTNHMNAELNAMCDYYIETFGKSVETTIQKDRHGLTADKVPIGSYMSRFFQIASMLRKQPPYPKFTPEGISRTIDLALKKNSEKTIRKYKMIVKIMLDQDDDGPTLQYNAENFVRTISKIVQTPNQEQQLTVWRNKIGYKFIMAQKSDYTLARTRLTALHWRINETKKQQLWNIITKKHAGRVKNVWSLEMTQGIIRYMEESRRSSKVHADENK